jgi:transcriptional regulator with XRE-family HTH domain
VDDSQAVGERARAWRMKRGLSQARVAQLAGLPQTSLSNYETGKRPFSLALALRLSAALDITLGDLVGTTDLVMMRDSRLASAFMAVIQADPVLSLNEEWRSFGPS